MQTLLNERTWRFQKLILLILFIFSPIMLVVLLYLRGLESLSSQVLFSVAVNLLGLLICGLLFISCVKDQKDRSLRTACFAHLIGLTALQMFLSSASYMTPVHGIWVTVIMLEETVLNVGGLLLTLVFFAYIKELAKAWDSVLEWIRKTVTAVAVLLILLSIGNLVGHYLFYMDNGVFVQTEYYPLITLFPLIANIMYVLFSSRMALEPAEKRALLTFIFLPTVGLLIYYFTGVVAVYAAVLCSLIFIYGIVFKTREEELIRSNLEIAQKENELLRVKNDQVRVETELNTAAEIQSRLLPKTFPFFPMFESFDLYATMQPAKEVGGDFYDFFQIDEDHIGLVIADVSGKGIPAALYMMVAKTMIKNVAMQGKTPAEVLETVNHQLCDGGTDLEMFVTVWYGIYEVSSGRLIAANGGHEYPVVKQPNGSFELLKDKHSLVLGGMDGIRYHNYELTLKPGSTLFVYTDGIPEATNQEEKLFGTERMLEALNQAACTDPQQLIRALHQEVNRFVGEAPQFDDMTMLGLMVKEDTEDMVFETREYPASVDYLDRAMAFAEEKMEAAGVPVKAAMQISVALEELFVNIAHYAYPEAEGKLWLGISIADDCVSIRLTDRGLAFDPLAKADPDTTLSAEERPIGGLGIHMVKKTMDEVSYEYSDGENRITIKKKI